MEHTTSPLNAASKSSTTPHAVVGTDDQDVISLIAGFTNVLHIDDSKGKEAQLNGNVETLEGTGDEPKCDCADYSESYISSSDQLEQVDSAVTDDVKQQDAKRESVAHLLSTLCRPCDHHDNLENKTGSCYSMHERRLPVDGLIKEEILKRQKGKCCYGMGPNCPTTIELDTMQVEHIVPWSKGGYDGLINFAAACGSCNPSKGAKDIRALYSTSYRTPYFRIRDLVYMARRHANGQ
jgi:5-methylcytosine-specific restriction endonuclease McrA